MQYIWHEARSCRISWTYKISNAKNNICNPYSIFDQTNSWRSLHFTPIQFRPIFFESCNFLHSPRHLSITLSASAAKRAQLIGHSVIRINRYYTKRSDRSSCRLKEQAGACPDRLSMSRCEQRWRRRIGLLRKRNSWMVDVDRINPREVVNHR